MTWRAPNRLCGVGQPLACWRWMLAYPRTEFLDGLLIGQELEHHTPIITRSRSAWLPLIPACFFRTPLNGMVCKPAGNLRPNAYEERRCNCRRTGSSRLRPSVGSILPAGPVLSLTTGISAIYGVPSPGSSTGSSYP